jgi:hypothetical protein
MLYYDNNNKLIYGPKTCIALNIIFNLQLSFDWWTPIKGFGLCSGFSVYDAIKKIDSCNLMTPEITQELQDYIFKRYK